MNLFYYAVAAFLLTFVTSNDDTCKSPGRHLLRKITVNETKLTNSSSTTNETTRLTTTVDPTTTTTTATTTITTAATTTTKKPEDNSTVKPEKSTTEKVVTTTTTANGNKTTTEATTTSAPAAQKRTAPPHRSSSGDDGCNDLRKGASKRTKKNCHILQDGRSIIKTAWLAFIICLVIGIFLIFSGFVFLFLAIFLKRIAQTDKDSRDTMRGPGNAPGLADLQNLPNFSERLDTKKSVSHDKREKHRQFIAARKKQHKEEENSAKFKKRGAIFIPLDIEKCDFKKMANKDPTNVVLTKVVYDESRNEQFDIGTDIDDIELAPSTTTDENTHTKQFSKSMEFSKTEKSFL